MNFINYLAVALLAIVLTITLSFDPEQEKQDASSRIFHQNGCTNNHVHI